MARTATEVIQDHLMKRLSGDIEGDIKENYSTDVIILSSFGVFRGHAGVRESAAKLAAEVGDATFQYNHTIIETSCAFLEWTGESDKKIVRDVPTHLLCQMKK
ncbi:MAG TPA: nuclear transport factor 2 family protein [Candidatus Limnocylindrales bacterium]|nr:nuclear transport factor 2 family protein [Candidatus Limnocylindrales bacterium]